MRVKINNRKFKNFKRHKIVGRKIIIIPIIKMHRVLYKKNWLKLTNFYERSLD